jgi:hypothetical protein
VRVLTDEEHAEEPTTRHQPGKLDELLFARLMSFADECDRVHARGGRGVLAEQLEPGEIDEHMRE